jgi:anaphase-promoting complex subunit 2
VNRSLVLPSWLRTAIEKLGQDIEDSIYNDLAGCQASNSFQASMKGLGLEVQWGIHANRAAERLVLHRARSVERQVDQFEEGALSNLQTWLRTSLIATLHLLHMDHLASIESRLDYLICLELGRIRSRQLFDIIKDYPLSTPALTDLNTCSDQCNLQPYISQHLSQSLEARLLHPGASTRDIVQFYTHLIRGLRFIDPSGVILSHVIGPVRTYLRARTDTIPVIVASLLGQAGDFTLLRDMMRESGDVQGGLGAADTSLAVYEEDDSNEPMSLGETTRMIVIPSADEQDWTPRPIDAGPDYRQSRKSDVIAIIVSIFDDEEGFVAALEKSCAEQLMEVDGYDTSKEYEVNENLKKRFGDASLSRCDVMLNDVKKSQRYNRAIQRTEEADSEKGKAFHSLQPFILSRQFWPPIKESAPMPVQATTSSMFGSATTTATPLNGSPTAVLSGKSVKMPGQFARALEQYQDAFKTMAPMRRLRWFNTRSKIELDLEMDDGRVIKETVTPLQAAIVEVAAEMKASRENPMELSSLVLQLGAEKEVIVEAINYWTSRGILRAVDSESLLFEVVESISG